MEIDFTEIYCHVDDFCKGFVPWWRAHLLEYIKKDKKSHMCRNGHMILSEVVTITKLTLLGYQESKFSWSKFSCFMCM
ncbi:hypothetical protein MIDIC_500002 [Alphaproteobacteria bacterium]